jgi:phage-related protein
MLKTVAWLGDSRKVVRKFSGFGRRQMGRELFRLQAGADPLDWKPMRAIGAGACEIRVHSENEYRVIYVAKFAAVVYVLHAFTKKTQATSLHDVRLAKQRYGEMEQLRKMK